MYFVFLSITMKVKRDETFDDVLEFYDKTVEFSTYPSLSEAGSAHLLFQLKDLTHFQYLEVYINLTQVVGPGYALPDIDDKH